MQAPRSRRVSAIALFTALAFVLNLAVKIPAPYAPFLVYQVWEVPIYAAFLIFGGWVGVVVAVLNLLILQAVYPGPLPSGPLYNLAAVLATMLGITMAHRTVMKSGRGAALITASATSVGTVSRVVIMTVINGVFLPFSYPVGFSIPVSAIPSLLVLIGVFNATLSLYTVPLSYAVLRTVTGRYRLSVAYPLHREGLAAPAS